MNKLTDTFTLSNGVTIPCIGYGTWQTPDGEVAVNAVKEAIKAGYRHIDTASAYKNEASVGQAIKECGVPREELFITSKVWRTERGYDKTIASFNKTLEDLQTDYLDLYLIHWPAPQKVYPDWNEINLDTWRALMDLYKAGKIRAIGVSNFLPHYLKPLLDQEIKPMVNQIEIHPGQMQEELVELCREHNILVEAWAPLGTGRMLNDERLLEIAKKYNKSVAQICIKWCLQNDFLPLPKSLQPAHIQDNGDVFDFEISKEDMEFINAMPYFAGSGINPDEVAF